MKDALRPHAALTHPAWLLALGLLVFNDHFLKASGYAPLVSGKLSDFAGLFVAPVLLAALLGVRTRGGLWAAAVATGVVFSAINLFPFVAAAWDGAVSLIVPFRTTVDPTDLIALTMIPAALSVLGPAMRAQRDTSAARRHVQYALALAGFVMCTATSEDESCTSDSDCRDGDVCEDEWCTTPPKACTTDADCPEEYLECAQGFCSYRPMCDEGSQCPSGVCETDGRCDLAGTPIGGSSMMSVLEAESLDLRTREEVQTRPDVSIDPAVLDYLADPALPAALPRN